MTIRLNGSTSGYVELDAPAVAGTTVLELPTDSIKPGMVLVASQSFSAVSSVSVNNCFTATYDNYLIYLNAVASATANLSVRMRLSGTDNTSAAYMDQYLIGEGTNASAVRNQSQTSSVIALGRSAEFSVGIQMYLPASAVYTRATSQATDGSTGVRHYSMQHAVSTAYDGLTFFPASGTITGTLRIYGLRNA